jgi:hypothetical protein
MGAPQRPYRCQESPMLPKALEGSSNRLDGHNPTRSVSGRLYPIQNAEKCRQEPEVDADQERREGFRGGPAGRFSTFSTGNDSCYLLFSCISCSLLLPIKAYPEAHQTVPGSTPNRTRKHTFPYPEAHFSVPGSTPQGRRFAHTEENCRRKKGVPGSTPLTHLFCV